MGQKPTAPHTGPCVVPPSCALPSCCGAPHQPFSLSMGHLLVGLVHRLFGRPPQKTAISIDCGSFLGFVVAPPSQKAVFYSRPTPQTNLVPHNVGGVVELKTLVFFLLLLKKKITSIKIKKTTDHRGRYYCKPYESVGRNGTVEIATRCILRETSLFQEKEREKKMKFWPSILAGGGGSGQALFFWFG